MVEVAVALGDWSPLQCRRSQSLANSVDAPAYLAHRFGDSCGLQCRSKLQSPWGRAAIPASDSRAKRFFR